MNIEWTEYIDSVAYEEDSRTLIMLLSDGMDWEDENTHLLLLQAKLNSYILYIDTRQFEEKYPQVEKIKLGISFFYEDVPNLCMKLLEHAGEVLVDIYDNIEITVSFGIGESRGAELS